MASSDSPLFSILFGPSIIITIVSIIFTISAIYNLHKAKQIKLAKKLRAELTFTLNTICSIGFLSRYLDPNISAWITTWSHILCKITGLLVLTYWLHHSFKATPLEINRCTFLSFLVLIYSLAFWILIALCGTFLNLQYLTIMGYNMFTLSFLIGIIGLLYLFNSRLIYVSKEFAKINEMQLQRTMIANCNSNSKSVPTISNVASSPDIHTIDMEVVESNATPTNTVDTDLQRAEHNKRKCTQSVDLNMSIDIMRNSRSESQKVRIDGELYNIVIKNTVLITFIVISMVMMIMIDYVYFAVFGAGMDLNVFAFFMLTMDTMIQCGCILLMFKFSNIVYDKLCVKFHLMCIKCGVCCGICCCCGCGYREKFVK